MSLLLTMSILVLCLSVLPSLSQLGYSQRDGSSNNILPIIGKIHIRSPKTNPRPAAPASGRPISTGKKGRLVCKIPVVPAVEFRLLARLDRRGWDNVCNLPQFTFKIPCDCKYARTAKNIPVITARIFIIYLNAIPKRKPTIPAKPTVVKKLSVIIFFCPFL
jgi:hypothetical protein